DDCECHRLVARATQRLDEVACELSAAAVRPATCGARMELVGQLDAADCQDDRDQNEACSRDDRLHAELTPGQPHHRCTSRVRLRSGGMVALLMYASTRSSMPIWSTVQAGSVTGSAVRISSVLWRSVWLAEMISHCAGSAARSHRGPLSSRCAASRSSTSAESCTREFMSTIR